MYKKIAFAAVGIILVASPILVSAQGFGNTDTCSNNPTIACLQSEIAQLVQLLNELLSARHHQNGQPYATIDQQTLTQSSPNFGIDGLTSASNIFVELVSSSYTGPTDYNSLSNLLKGSGQYNAVGNTAYVGQKACTSITQNCWDAAFNGIPSGSYTVYVFDGDSAPQWTLLTTGTLTVSSATSQPAITITSPVGTASWTQGTVATWTWTSSAPVPFVDIYLNVGGTNYAFATSYPNGGSFQWTVGALENAWRGSLSSIPNGMYSISVCPTGVTAGAPPCGQFSVNISGTAYVGAQYQINYVSPAEANAGTTVTLYGSNFDPYALVSMANQNGGPESEAIIHPISITPTAISFVVPATNASLTNPSTQGANTVQVFADKGQGGGFRTSNSVTLYVSGTPTTSFTASPASGAAPLTVNFTAVGPDVNQAMVDFGDGATGSPIGTCTIADPPPGGGPYGPDCTFSHTYQVGGSYTATLYESGVGKDIVISTTTVVVTSSSVGIADVPLPAQGLSDGRLLGFGITAFSASFPVTQLNFSITGSSTTAPVSIHAYTDASFSNPAPGLTAGVYGSFPSITVPTPFSSSGPNGFQIPAGATYYFLVTTPQGGNIANASSMTTSLTGLGSSFSGTSAVQTRSNATQTPTVTYVSNSGGSVTGSYANLPAGSQIVVINQTSGQAVSGVSASVSGSGSVTLNNLPSGAFYLEAKDSSGNYLAQSVVFYASGTTVQAPTVTLTADGQSAITKPKGGYTVAWSSSNATSCTLSWQGTGSDAAQSGSSGETPNQSASGGSGLIGSYTFTCTGASGQQASATVTISAPAPSSTVTYVSNSGGSVTGSYANLPAGSQIVVINVTSNQPVSGVNAAVSGSGTVTLNNLPAGSFYLKAQDAAGNYLAQSVTFYSAGSTTAPTTGTCTRTVSGSMNGPTTINISGGASACSAYCSSLDLEDGTHSSCVYNDLSASGSGNANLANALTALQSALQALEQWLGR